MSGCFGEEKIPYSTNCVFGLYPSSGVSRTNKIKNYRQKTKPK
jgi:hypothetical protein